MTMIKAIYKKNNEVSPTNNLMRLILDEDSINFQNINEEPNFVYCSFKQNQLKKIKTEDKELLTLIERILNNKFHECSACGSISLNYAPYTYRDYHGCIGRSYECIDCQGLPNKHVSVVFDIQEQYGHERAIQYVDGLIRTQIIKNSKQVV